MGEFWEITKDFVSEIFPVILFCMLSITVILFLFTLEIYLITVGIILIFVISVFNYSYINLNKKGGT